MRRQRTKRALRALVIGELVALATLFACAGREPDMPETVAEGEAGAGVAVRSADIPIAGVAPALYRIPRGVVVVGTLTREESVREAEINWEDCYLLAQLIDAEVGSAADDECLIACGSVVLNRVADDEFPDTIRGVIYQTTPCLQYSVVASGRINREPSARSLRIAEELLRNGSQIPENVIYQSMHRQGSGIWRVICGEYFCYR